MFKNAKQAKTIISLTALKALHVHPSAKSMHKDGPMDPVRTVALGIKLILRGVELIAPRLKDVTLRTNQLEIKLQESKTDVESRGTTIIWDCACEWKASACVVHLMENMLKCWNPRNFGMASMNPFCFPLTKEHRLRVMR